VGGVAGLRGYLCRCIRDIFYEAAGIFAERPEGGGEGFWQYVRDYFSQVLSSGVPVIFVLDSGVKTVEKSLAAGKRAARRGKVEEAALKSIVRMEQAALSKANADVKMDERRQYRRILKKEKKKLSKLQRKLFLFTPALAAYLLESSGDLDVVIAPAEVRVYFECCICIFGFKCYDNFC
jgi:hypothetical protein